MLKTPKSQRGMTGISIMMILALAGFVLAMAFKLFPFYLEGFKVNSTLKGLTNDSRVEGASDRQVKDLILKKLQVDDVDTVTSEHIKIDSSSKKRMVSIEYEARVHMAGNIDAVVVFGDNAVEIER